VGEIDWYPIKFLESTSNIKKVIKKAVGREPSTRIANEIVACLQQGRMFFEAARNSPIEIRPLQSFYGIVGFSKAIILARYVKGYETLVQSHGLKDISPANARIESLELKILKRGTFQQFNDVISTMDQVQYFEKSTMPVFYKIPSDVSDKITDMKINIKEILSRIPGLERLYQDTFSEHPKNWPILLNYRDEYNGLVELRIDDPQIFTDRESLKTIVQKWRAKHPFLENWRLYEATHAWGYSILIFVSYDKSGTDEFAEKVLIEENGSFRGERDIRLDRSYKRIDFLKSLPPLSGGLKGSSPHMIEAYEGAFISEYALHYLGMFLLSSLVRYRPQIWRHAITSSLTGEKTADDKALALVENFLDLSIFEFVAMVSKAMNAN
jgi:hypothetical protein